MNDAYEEETSEELLIITHENLCHAFPKIGSEIIWEVLTSYEFSQKGIESSINAIMEMSGNKPIDFDEMEEISLNNGNTMLDNYGESSNGDTRSRIEKFDDDNNFNPIQSYGNSISNFAANIWSNIRRRTYGSMSYDEVGDKDEIGDKDDGVEMTEPLFENKKDK